jgi:hypothetical protein
MAEREAIYRLKFQIDKGGQQESVRAIDALAKEFAEVDSNAQAVSKSAQNAVNKLIAFGKGRNELRAVADEAKGVAIGSDAMGDALDRGIDKLHETADEAKRAAVNTESLGDAMVQAANKVEKTSQSISELSGRLDAADENFDVISRRVGLAGDVQSNLGAIRGLSDVAGLGGVGQGIGIAGEIAALTEELPRLKAALSNMPDVVKFVSSEVGATGVGLIGALGGLAIVLSLAAKAAEAERNRKLAELQAADQYSQFAITATFDEAVARREALKADIERQQALLANVQSQLDQVESSAVDAARENFGDNVAADLIGQIGAGIRKGSAELGVGRGDIQALQEEYNRLNGEIANNVEFFNLISGGLQNGTFAANEATKAIDEQAQRTIDFYQQQYDFQLKYNDLVTNGSKEQFDQVLAQNKLETDANRERIKGLYAQVEVFKQAGKEIPENLQLALDGAISASFELSAAQVYLTDTVAPLVEARTAETAAIEQTTKALQSVVERTKERNALEEQLAKEQVSRLKEQMQSELEFNRFLKTATAENVASRMEALQEEAAALRSLLPELQKLAPTSEAAADELQATTDKLAEINDELRRLGSEGVIAAIQREQAELTAEIEKIEADRDAKIADIRRQSAQKEIELYEDLQRDLADAVADANEERADAQREYQEEAAQIEQDLARKRLEIEKKYSKDAANAIGDRDALALYRAKQARNEQIEDAEDAASQARQDLQRNYQQQLETINRELAKQQQALQAKYQQQLNDLRTATANSINLERQKAAQEIAARQQAYQQELALLNSFAQQGAMSISTFATNSLSTLGGFVTQAQAIMAGLISSTANSPIPTPNPTPTGGSNTPPVEGRMGGPQPYPSAGLVINVEGHTITTIQQQIYDVLKNIIPS